MRRITISNARANAITLAATKMKEEHPCLRMGQALVNEMTSEELGCPWPELFYERDSIKAWELFCGVISDVPVLTADEYSEMACESYLVEVEMMRDLDGMSHITPLAYLKYKYSLHFPSSYLERQGIEGVFISCDDKKALPGGYLACLYIPDRDSNLDMHYIYVTGYDFNKELQILGKSAAEEAWCSLALDGTINLSQLTDYLDDSVCDDVVDIEYAQLPTTGDWCGTYPDGTVRAHLSNLPSMRIPTWTIHLSGTDDYSISKDFLSESEATAEWKLLLEMKDVHEDSLTDYYFSN